MDYLLIGLMDSISLIDKDFIDYFEIINDPFVKNLTFIIAYVIDYFEIVNYPFIMEATFIIAKIMVVYR